MGTFQPVLFLLYNALMDTAQNKNTVEQTPEQKKAAERKIRWMTRLVVFMGVLIVICLLLVCYGLFQQFVAMAEKG